MPTSRAIWRPCEAFGAEILKLCVEVGGCLTGEHGVGVEKRDLMLTQYTPVDIEAQLRVKDVFDPQMAVEPGEGLSIAEHGQAAGGVRGLPAPSGALRRHSPPGSILGTKLR